MSVTIVLCGDTTCTRMLNGETCHFVDGEPYCQEHFMERRHRP